MKQEVLERFKERHVLSHIAKCEVEEGVYPLLKYLTHTLGVPVRVVIFYGTCSYFCLFTMHDVDSAG